jgi:hypothetical protein
VFRLWDSHCREETAHRIRTLFHRFSFPPRAATHWVTYCIGTAVIFIRFHRATVSLSTCMSEPLDRESISQFIVEVEVVGQAPRICPEPAKGALDYQQPPTDVMRKAT